MKYVGLQTQIWRNNFRSTLLLILFPLLIYVLVGAFSLFVHYQYNGAVNGLDFFIHAIPWVTGGVLIWFLIAYFSHSTMIKSATGARPLARKENKRVYNLIENLCISVGMQMPKVNIIEDNSLNAFASGIDKKTYTITLSRGIIEKLNDEELEAVIAHELTHIRNHDVRLLIISIVFVGIFSFLGQIALRSLVYGGRNNRKKDQRLILVGMILAFIGYALSIVFKFALSRKREFLADAGAAEITKRPLALASALQKVSQDSRIEAVKRQDVAQLFIENPRDKEKKGFLNFSGLFATHPPIEKRIEMLQQF